MKISKLNFITLICIIMAVVTTGCVNKSEEISVPEMSEKITTVEAETTEEPKIISTLTARKVSLDWEKKPVVVEDESGIMITMPYDLNEWFENAVLVKISNENDDGWFSGINIDDDGEVILIEGGDRYNFIFSVDSTEYTFSFGPGSQIAVDKTENGYILLPEETVKLSPPQGPGGYRNKWTED